MGELFGRDQSVISRHIRNILKEGELLQKSNMHKMHIVGSDKPVAFYSLDAIISTGYRVKPWRGTEFRIWATNTLKQHLIQGCSVNEKRLMALKQTLKLASNISKHKLLSGNEVSILLQTISEYAYALDLLDDCDHQRVAIRRTCGISPFCGKEQVDLRQRRPKTHRRQFPCRHDADDRREQAERKKEVITAMLINLIMGK